MPVSVHATKQDSRVGRGRCASDLSYLETHFSLSPSVGSGAASSDVYVWPQTLGMVTEKEICGQDDENVDEIDAESSDDDTSGGIVQPANPAGKRLATPVSGIASQQRLSNGNGNGNGIYYTQRTAPTPDSEVGDAVYRPSGPPSMDTGVLRSFNAWAP